MKKLKLLFLTLLLSVVFSGICYGTDVESSSTLLNETSETNETSEIVETEEHSHEDDTTYLYTNESGELIQSDEYEYSDDATLIEDLEDYEDLYEDLNNQEDLKQAFQEQQAQMIVPTEEYSESSKLVITEILSDIKTEYTTDYYYYYIIKYQLAKVRDEEGLETSAIVILSYDVTDNQNIHSLKAGDEIYGYIEYISSDSENYNIVNHGLDVDTIALVSIQEHDRSLGVILLIILTVLLLLLYAGKHGAKLLIPIFVVIDLLFIVLIPELELGKNILLIAALIALELIVLITVLKNGWSRKTVVALISSIIVVVLITALASFFAYTNSLSGTGIISEENYDLQSNVYYIDYVLKTHINSQSLYLAFILIITSVIVATISSKLVELSEKYAGTKDMANSIIEEAKTKLSDYPMIITIIFLVMSLPKYMPLVYGDTPLHLLLNSETLITDLSLLLLTLIGTILSAPVTAIISSILMGNVEIKRIDEK